MILNENILNKITNINTPDDVYIIFIGLVSKTKNHTIVNVAKVRKPDDGSKEKMDSYWIAEFAHQLNLRLPGGLTVLGFGLVSKKITSDKEGVLIKTVQRYYKKVPDFEKKFINNDFIVVVFENEKVIGKIVSGDSGLKMNDEVKFEKILLHSVVSSFTFKWDFYTSNGDTFSDKCSTGFDSLTKCLLNSNLFIKNGKLGNCNEEVRSNEKINLLINGWEDGEDSIVNNTFSYHFTLNVDMDLKCVVRRFDTFESALSCLKLTLLRSLYARIELYSLSAESITPIQKDNVQFHQMPKIVTMSNEDGDCLIDYAEGDNTINEMINEVKMLIGDYAVDKTIIDSTKERFCKNEEINNIFNFISNNSKTSSNNNNNILIYSSLIVVFLAILIFPILKYII
uniref:OB domain-containing protein n=1 Tax=Strongyloides stercoralis TaxID=6248 RepID=A0A0K0EPJ3_STRER